MRPGSGDFASPPPFFHAHNCMHGAAARGTLADLGVPRTLLASTHYARRLGVSMVAFGLACLLLPWGTTGRACAGLCSSARSANWTLAFKAVRGLAAPSMLAFCCGIGHCALGRGWLGFGHAASYGLTVLCRFDVTGGPAPCGLSLPFCPVPHAVVAPLSELTHESIGKNTMPTMLPSVHARRGISGPRHLTS